MGGPERGKVGERSALSAEGQSRELRDIRLLVDSSPDVIVRLDAGLRFLFVNPAFEALMEKPSAEILGKTPAEIGGDPSIAAPLKEVYERVVRTGREESMEFGYRDRRYQALVVPESGPDGEVGALMVYARDITPIRRTEDELRRKESEVTALVEHSPDIISRLDRSLRHLYINESGAKAVGASRERILGRTYDELDVPRALAGVWKEHVTLVFERGAEDVMEFELPGGDGARYYHTRIVPEFDERGRVATVMAIARDITEVRRANERIRYISYHDGVTGLYNRAYFEEELVRLDSPRSLPVSIIIADINNLKLTNDVFGREEGDRLLRTVADIMRASCRQEDIIARWGGDEFAVLLPKTDPGMAGLIAERIKRMCGQARQTAVHCSIAVGEGAKTRPEQDVQDIVRFAEERMYKNKVLESRENRRDVIAAMLSRVGRLDHDTRDHVRRMQVLALRVGRRLGINRSQLNDLVLFAALHDIGKAGMPEDLLGKPGKLSEEEWDIVKRHTELGYRIAHAFPELARVSDAILSHHERWDGAGYPRGLKDERIPLLVRILSIIDAYDVMTHARSYKKAFTQDEALEELRRGAGRQFDPELVEVFIDTIKGMRAPVGVP